MESSPRSSRAASAASVLETGLESVSLTVAHAEGWYEATARFSRTLRSSNRSTDCQVRASPSAARLCARQPFEHPPVQLDPPAVRYEPRDRVDERRLARAVRADQPDELALRDREVDLVERPQAAEGDRDAGRREDDGPWLRASGGARARPESTRRPVRSSRARQPRPQGVSSSAASSSSPFPRCPPG